MRQRGPRASSASATRSTSRTRQSSPTARHAQFGVFRCSSSVKGPALRELDRQRLLPEQGALVHLQGTGGPVRVVQDPFPEHRLRLVGRPRRLRVDGVRDQERPEAAAEAHPLRRRRPERQARLAPGHRPRDAGPLRRRPRAAPPADRGEGERPCLRLEHRMSARSRARPPRPASPAATATGTASSSAAPAGARSSWLPSRDRRRGSGAEGEGRATPTRCCPRHSERRSTRSGCTTASTSCSPMWSRTTASSCRRTTSPTG